MTLDELRDRAMIVRNLYSKLEIKHYDREWSNEEIALGFVGDVGDLAKLVMAKEGVREKDDVDQKLAHELADCLWSVLVLSEKYGINLEKAFLQTMDELEKKIKTQT